MVVTLRREPPTKIRVTVAIGTRPEAIKLLPVVRELRGNSDEFECRVVSTGQHRELLDQVFETFALEPDADLRLMQPGQRLDELCARTLVGMTRELDAHRPDLLLVQGDTVTAFASSLAAFWRACPVGHVEAGLRSGNHRHPFPEEMNRILTDDLSDLYFAPTDEAAANLRCEGVPDERVYVTGNSGIDALLHIAATPRGLPAGLVLAPDARVVLVTVHRQESFGPPLAEILEAVRDLVLAFHDLEVVLPVHPNPRVRGPVHRALGGLERIHLTPPLGYGQFVEVLRRSHLVLTDSGGVQEEAPVLGKPVLVLRRTTERPEGVAQGVARLVGTQRDSIVGEASRLLRNRSAYLAMARHVSPYGDGQAAKRIAQAVLHHFGRRSSRPECFAAAGAQQVCS